MGVMFVEVEANPSTDKSSALGASAALRWGLAVFAITAFQNTLTSGIPQLLSAWLSFTHSALIGILIWRIWSVERESDRHFSLHSGSEMWQPSHLRKVIRVIAESGAAYTAMTLLTFFVGISKSNALYPTSDMVRKNQSCPYFGNIQ
jgi:hypothetical protein